jgi:acetyl esterase/lipase
MKRRHLLAALPWLCPLARALAAEGDTGVVLLHGKQSGPKAVSDLAVTLRDAGCRVGVPEMPWSRRRDFDVAYPAALEEIAAACQALQGAGAQRIVVGGHSMGANAALAYAASGHPVTGVFALSPGHVAEAPRFRRQVADGVQKAREMVAAGTGEDKAWFPDTNQGRQRQVRTTALAYLSYFDPQGMGSLLRSCSALPAGVPLFMSVGESEMTLDYARGTLFPAAPANARSVFVAVPGDHFSAPRAAAPRLVQWLQGLAA